MKCPRCGYTDSMPSAIGGVGDILGLAGSYNIAVGPHYNAGMSPEEVSKMQHEQMIAFAKMRAFAQGYIDGPGGLPEIEEREGSVTFPGPPRGSIVVG